MSDLKGADGWTDRLAALLRADLTPADRTAALRRLAADGGQNTPARQSILQLLGRRLALLGQDHGPTPAAPDPNLQPQDSVPPLRQGGLDGVSLVSLAGPGLEQALPNWLTTQPSEVVVVDCNGAMGLAFTGTTDARVNHIRVAGDISPVQALNLGLRMARHARLVVLTPAIRLVPDYAAQADLPPASFLLEPGPADAGAFVLDLMRDAMAAAGGFNEFLPSMDWAVDDLAARLSAMGLRHADLAPRLMSRILPERPAQPLGTLRDALLADPDFAAMQNRALAAALPDWTGTSAVPAKVLAKDAAGWVLQTDGSAPQLPTHLLTQATDQALTDLLRRLDGAPEQIPPAGLAMVLARPVQDVWPTDFAVAITPHAAEVARRAAWAVIDIAADAVPHPGSPAAHACAQIADLTAAQGQTMVLRGDARVLSGVPMLAGLPVIPPSVDTFKFWPMGLRELARTDGTRPPRHATILFDLPMIRDLDLMALKAPQILLRRPKIFVDAQHGLGNRLRAIASAGAIAWGTERELVIIWQPDDHCACRFDDLYHPDCGVLTEGFVSEAASMGMSVYNYMEVEPGAAKDTPIHVDAFRDIYLRSAYPFQNFCSNWHTEFAFIHSLRLSEVVQDLVDSVRSPNDLSVHIRAEGGKSVEHLPYEAPSNWTPAAHAEIEHWRKRSQLGAFLPRIDALIAEGRADRIFAAADTPALYDILAGRYGDRLAWLPRNAADRSTEAIVYALADAILLGRSARLLGSHWSSFSELAARLAPGPMQVELAGRDF